MTAGSPRAIRRGLQPGAAPASASPIALVRAALDGDRRALARLITRLESGGEAAADALAKVYPHAGRAHVVGITGPPGSGKSSLAAALARWYRAHDERVAVLAVDPTSPYSGGALLGDRIRMADLATDEGVFVRSMASRGTQGGLALATTAIVAALDAAGYGRIVLETVGVGQDEVAVAQTAHTTVVVTVPGLGDEVQALKAGILEIADVLVVNKADRPGADQACAELALLQSLAPTPSWQPPVLSTVAIRDEGILSLAEVLEAHRAFLAENPEGERRAQARARAAVVAAAHAALTAKLDRSARAARWEPAYQAVATHARSPYAVAAELVASLIPEMES
jgi:LAO/AO transport system kinase